MAGQRKHLTLIAASALLALGSGCVTADANKRAESKKPDVTQPGVLPPPQEVMKPASAIAPNGPVLPAGTLTQTGASMPGPIAPDIKVTPPAAPPGPSAIAKLAGRGEKKIPATEMAVAWRPQIAYLPDPTKNGAMGCGIAGQLFLYGGPKTEFAQADGTLTVDLVDETPRAPGQPGAKPERWQFDKNTLRNLKTVDETFGPSYVLFLPWPAYTPDVTRVRISARYDPDNGHTLYQAPSVVSINTASPLGTPVWDGTTQIKPFGVAAGFPTQPLGAAAVQPGGGTNPSAPAPGSALLPAPLPIGGPAAPVSPLAPPAAPGAPAMPSGSTPEGFPPIAITIGQK